MTESLDLSDDLLRGVREIADFLGRKPRSVQYLLDNDLLLGAFKLGGVWHARRSTIRASIERLEEQARSKTPDAGTAA